MTDSSSSSSSSAPLVGAGRCFWPFTGVDGPAPLIAGLLNGTAQLSEPNSKRSFLSAGQDATTSGTPCSVCNKAMLTIHARLFAWWKIVPRHYYCTLKTEKVSHSQEQLCPWRRPIWTAQLQPCANFQAKFGRASRAVRLSPASQRPSPVASTSFWTSAKQNTQKRGLTMRHQNSKESCGSTYLTLHWQDIRIRFLQTAWVQRLLLNDILQDQERYIDHKVRFEHPSTPDSEIL